MVEPLLHKCEGCGFGGMMDYWLTNFGLLDTTDPSYIRFNGLPDHAKPLSDEFKCPKCNYIVTIERQKPQAKS